MSYTGSGILRKEPAPKRQSKVNARALMQEYVRKRCPDVGDVTELTPREQQMILHKPLLSHQSSC
jgi:phage FluMu protein Com